MILCVDFDGTIVEDAFPLIGEPRRGHFHETFIEDLIDLRKLGYKLILWTCRTGDTLDDAVQFCKSKGLEFDAVNDDLEEQKIVWAGKLAEWRDSGKARKVFAHYYIDDRAKELTSCKELFDFCGLCK